jgi:hypothetical protein
MNTLMQCQPPFLSERLEANDPSLGHRKPAQRELGA